MAGFTIDLAGRVKNFDLPKTQPLIPLFEAVVNSIYAIEERMEREDFKGKIDIRIIREPQEIAPVEGINSTINEIIGFSISDNGIGLDDNNMKSFLQSDSTYQNTDRKELDGLVYCSILPGAEKDGFVIDYELVRLYNYNEI